MARRIVILNGAPRRSGSTAALVNAFAEGARGAGCEVQEFHLDSMNIHGRLGASAGTAPASTPVCSATTWTKFTPPCAAAT